MFPVQKLSVKWKWRYSTVCDRSNLETVFETMNLLYFQRNNTILPVVPKQKRVQHLKCPSLEKETGISISPEYDVMQGFEKRKAGRNNGNCQLSTSDWYAQLVQHLAAYVSIQWQVKRPRISTTACEIPIDYFFWDTEQRRIERDCSNAKRTTKCLLVIVQHKQISNQGISTVIVWILIILTT